MVNKRSRSDDDNDDTNHRSAPQKRSDRRVYAIRPPTEDGPRPEPLAFRGKYLASGSVRLSHHEGIEHKQIRDFTMELFRTHGNGGGTDLSLLVQKLQAANERLANETNRSLHQSAGSTVSRESYARSRNIESIAKVAPKASAAPVFNAAPSAPAVFKAAPSAPAVFNTAPSAPAASNAAPAFKAAPPAPAAFKTGASTGFTFGASPPVPFFGAGTTGEHKPAATTDGSNTPPSAPTFNFQPSHGAPPAQSDDTSDTLHHDDHPNDAVQVIVEDGWTLVKSFEDVRNEHSVDLKTFTSFCNGNLDIQQKTSDDTMRLLMKTMHDTFFNIVPRAKPTLSRGKKNFDYIILKGENAVEDDNVKGERIFRMRIRKAHSQELFDIIDKAVQSN